MISNYSFKWLLQRITAILLIPLSFWFIFQCVSFQNFKYFEIQLFFQSYINSFLFLMLMIAMLIHAKLGCETIVQDYASSLFFKKILKNLINFITFFSLFLVIIAIFKMSIF